MLKILMIFFAAKYRLAEADAVRKDVSSSNRSITYPDSLITSIKVITFCVDLSFSSNAKCYKILKINVWPITASSRHRKRVYTGVVPIT